MKELNYKKVPKDTYVIKYGALGDDFYIMLEGEVSAWVPVPHKEMIKPLQQFKKRIKNDILSKNSNTMINFRFHLNPFKMAPGSPGTYCTYEEFSVLCSKDTPEKMV